MPDLQGYITFPGIDQVIEGSFTLSHGITPSVCTLDIQPQADFIASVGPLVLVFGPTELVFPGCKIDQASFRYGPDGLIWGLSIWDRRWRWQWGDLSGTYNERIPLLNLGSIDAYTLRTPQQLMAYCLLAMGEANFDVSLVPNASRPEVRWQDDVPARALAELCDLLDCRVVLGLDSAVRVIPSGLGAALPADGVLQDGLLFKAPNVPDTITVVGGATRYQCDFALEAVGLDVNGNVEPINQLSYMPKGGWGMPGACPPFFGAVPIGVNVNLPPYINWPPAQLAAFLAQNPRPNQLAIDTVFKWYRITTKALDKQNALVQIPGWGGSPGNRIQGLWQILPVEDVQVEGYTDADGLFRSDPAKLVGTWVYDGDLAFLQVPAGTGYNKPFSIDKDRGIVVLAQPEVRWGPGHLQQPTGPGSLPLLPPWLQPPKAWLTGPGPEMIPAEFFLRVAVSVRDPLTSAWDRVRRTLDLGTGLGTPTRVLKHEEIVLSVVPIYDLKHTVTGLKTTAQNAVQECDYYLAAAAAEYHLDAPQDRLYAGLRADVPPDGAVQQITWSVGPRGATTRASRNTEWHPVVPPYRERRQLERLAKLAKTEPELLSLTRDRSGRQPPRGVGDSR